METSAPSLTERRKAATQLEIAKAAARLFADRGADAVTAEEIARQAGVAVRTFYRYFRTKEDAVAPLLTVGAGHWRALLAAADPQEELLDALERTIVEVLTPNDDADLESLRWTLGLLRASEMTRPFSSCGSGSTANRRRSCARSSRPSPGRMPSPLPCA